MRYLVRGVGHRRDHESELHGERLDSPFIEAVEGVFVSLVHHYVFVRAEEPIGALLDSLHLRGIDRVALWRDLLNVRENLVVNGYSSRVVCGELSVELLSRLVPVAIVAVLAKLSNESDCRALLDSRLLGFVLRVHEFERRLKYVRPVAEKIAAVLVPRHNANSRPLNKRFIARWEREHEP